MQCNILYNNSLSIFTDGSSTQEGVVVVFSEDLGILFCNFPNHCSFFHTEFTAIRQAIRKKI